MRSSSQKFNSPKAADYLSVCPGTIYNWINQGKLKGRTLHGAPKGHVRILRKDLDKVVTGES